MNKVTTRIIVITFNNKIQPWEVPQFRGGIINKVGIEHDWFHNHNNQAEPPKFLYRYPLIQYRYHNGNPQLICIQNGVEEVQQLFSQSDWEIRIGDRTEQLSIKDLNLKAIDVELVNHLCNYQLQHWLPFNSQNLERYKVLEYEIDRIQFLEKILTGHLLAFAAGIGWQVENKLNVRIKRIVKQKIVPYKYTKMLSFNIDFTVNAKLPFQAGIGQGASRGFGLLNVPTNVLRGKGKSKQALS
jgi:hypothetical protein